MNLKAGAISFLFMVCLPSISADRAIEDAAIDALRGLRVQQGDAKEQTLPMSKPLWHLDLGDKGFNDDNNLDREARFAELKESLEFLGNDVVAANFVKRENLRKSADPSSRLLPFSLHVIFLDASTGKVVAEAEYGSNTTNAGLFALDDGSYVIFAGNHLSLYSSNRLLVKDLPLPELDKPKTSLVGITASPSGHTLLVRYMDGEQQQCNWVSVPQMQIRTESCRLPAQIAITDHEMAAVDQPDPKSSKAKIAIQKIDGSWHLLCDSSSNPACGNPRFVDDSTILISTLNALAAVHQSGQLVFTEAMSDAPLTSPLGSVSHSSKIAEVRSSISGNRIAAGIYGLTNIAGSFNSNFDVVSGAQVMFDHARVYDLVTGRWIFKLENDDPSDAKFRHLSGLALSPNGRRIAIETSGIVREFELSQ